ncbi:hypothetical protein [Actinoplanes awajinensis]|uniref:Excreted virulence factor EspC (Type VII ESX diderm) n=1 Tax=Actinoplanes awajinensis subsp. mycoplanecinus TaxID=135947 RepID=A0A124G725_9ACTN|nr:hypothetical protein [Actinoplanes awajinensis]KUL21415.1 hypothetical protein ADL15_50695 [Actinoplanes awajinensis subsp. mycoplanecinus]
MADGIAAEIEQIRAHAANIEALRGRFVAVKGASAQIAGDSAAYGLLCGWIAGILEGRHTRQDELIAFVEENLSLVAEGLHKTADNYEATESENNDSMISIRGRLDG